MLLYFYLLATKLSPRLSKKVCHSFQVASFLCHPPPFPFLSPLVCADSSLYSLVCVCLLAILLTPAPPGPSKYTRTPSPLPPPCSGLSLGEAAPVG